MRHYKQQPDFGRDLVFYLLWSLDRAGAAGPAVALPIPGATFVASVFANPPPAPRPEITIAARPAQIARRVLRFGEVVAIAWPATIKLQLHRAEHTGPDVQLSLDYGAIPR